VPKAFTSARELKYEDRVAFSELYVRRSRVTPAKYFTDKNLTTGWGLFLPEHREGMCLLRVCVRCLCACLHRRVCLCEGFTEELVFEGPHVLHVQADTIQTWQRAYAIEDTFKDGMVFVPDTPACICKLFRVQHDEDDPTHELAQIDADRCVLVPLRKMRKGGELTFDYFGSEDDMVSSATVCADSSTDPDHSLSLSSSQSVGGSQVVLTGNGTATTARLMAMLEARFNKIGSEEVCESLAF